MTEQKLYRIQFEDPAATEEVCATWLGEDRYRLDEEPIFSEAATFRDVIEAEVRPDGALKFRRVVQRSAYETSRFLLSQEAVASAAFGALKQRVVDLGGEWDLSFNGYLMLHLPRGVHFDAESEVLQVETEARRKGAAS